LHLETVQPRDLEPGDMAELKYNYGPKRKFLIVSTRRTKNKGNFLSTKDNDLLCCYEITERYSTLSMLLNNLYKNKNRCSYVKSPALLNLVFGSDKFRTLNFIKILALSEIIIPINKN